MSAGRIISEEARRGALPVSRLTDPTDRHRRVTRARASTAFRLYMEVDMPSRLVARELGFADRTSAVDAILRGAKAAGYAVSRLSELKGGRSSRIDWCKFAYAVAGWRQTNELTQDAAARRARLSRMVLIHAESGMRLEAETFVQLCAAMGRDPRGFLKTDKRETTGEQTPEGRP